MSWQRSKPRFKYFRELRGVCGCGAHTPTHPMLFPSHQIKFLYETLNKKKYQLPDHKDMVDMVMYSVYDIIITIIIVSVLSGVLYDIY